MKECNKSVYLANKSIDMIDAVNKGYADGYNKAIDDFAEYVWETTSISDIERITRDYELYDLLQKKAEQLKEGVNINE